MLEMGLCTDVNTCISLCDFRVFGDETIVVSHGSKLVMD